MPSDTKASFDQDKLIAALEKMAATPNRKKETLKDKISEPRILEAIKKARAAKYGPAEIADLMTSMGIEIRPSTLAVYLRELDANEKGEADGKPHSKPKTNKTRTAKASAEVKVDKPTDTPETPPATNAATNTATNPAFRDRKSL